MRRLRSFFRNHNYLRITADALLLTLLIEFLCRKSLTRLAEFVFLSPLTFLFNALIIFLSLLLSKLFPRRQAFAECFIALIWILFGSVNAVVLRYRMTPFSAEDFNMIPSLLRIAKNYMNLPMILLCAGALLLLAVLTVCLWLRLPVSANVHRWRTWFLTIFQITLTAVAGYFIMGYALHTNAISRNFMNLADAYEKYGFAYCFTNSLVDKGIGRPDSYSRKKMKKIADGIRAGQETGVNNVAFHTVNSKEADIFGTSGENMTAEKPNIIMIQLESFFDPCHIKGYEYSEDPIPNFRSISDNFASGNLTVPVVGAGTANTEFEILTGMSTDYFGAGEYPYNTVLQDRTVESVPNVLRAADYTSTVIHNNTGTFYHRDTVFSQMGFDTFIPAEYMNNLETTPNNWAKDNILPGIILDCMQRSGNRDFVYAITVQSHGRYPEEIVLENPRITASCEEETASLNAVTYYVNEIFEVDEMIADLTALLEDFEEPTILVMFGDHLPALGFKAEDLTQSSVYETEYVVWNNFGLDLADREMRSESLSSAILSTFDLAGGIIPQFHKVYDQTSLYRRYLELIEYDMLYGEGYIFREFPEEVGLPPGSVTELETDEPLQPYEATDLEIGYKKIEITRWNRTGSVLYVYGRNFTPSSRIVIGEKPYDTVYINENILAVTEKTPEEFSALYVGQFDENLVELGDGSNTLPGETR